MITINAYLDNILEDFQEYLDSGVCLCDLKDVHFDAGKIPDYNENHIQQYYLLRFAYAYAFEYKCMYTYLFRKYTFEDEIKAVSIGCGTGIDYWAMAAALKEAGLQDKAIKYKGFDLIDWNYKFKARKNDTVDFYQGDVTNIFARAKTLGSNVYCFPKSISEFSTDQIGMICDAFKTKPITKDKIHILVSVRSNEFHMQEDTSKVEKLKAALTYAGFTLLKGSDTCLCITQRGKKIREVDDEFKHPYDVYNTLSSLNTKCNQYQNYGMNCEKDCENRLSRKPIVNCDQVVFQALAFEKG